GHPLLRRRGRRGALRDEGRRRVRVPRLLRLHRLPRPRRAHGSGGAPPPRAPGGQADGRRQAGADALPPQQAHHMCPDHRFAFASLRDTVSLISKEFTSDAASSIETIRSLAATETRYAVADLTHLFKIAYEEGKRAETQGRLLRVVLIYCRSSTKPHHQWPVKPKNFTMDIVYLHDKPTADNCPQNVYDALVDALEHVSQYEGYILESGQGLARVLFRQICIILSHPLLRCMQDDLDIPKQVVKKILAIEGVQSEDGAPVSSSQ
uniref:BRISC and BRCA1-A complex member 1 n=1 Tax=Aegilops tauschii subsp. strangulata TaxID=200361 RepID=A0A453QP93_AEGTS